MSSDIDFLSSGEALLSRLGGFWTTVYRGEVPSGRKPPAICYGEGLAACGRYLAGLAETALRAGSLGDLDSPLSASAARIVLHEGSATTAVAAIGGSKVTGIAFAWKDCELASGWEDAESGFWKIAGVEKVVTKLDETGVVLNEGIHFAVDADSGRIIFAANPFSSGHPLYPYIQAQVRPDYTIDRIIPVFLKGITLRDSRPRHYAAPLFGNTFLAKIKNPHTSGPILDLAGKAALQGMTDAILEKVLDLAFPGVSGRSWTRWYAWQYTSIDIPSLTIPKQVLGSAYSGGLTFQNATLPTDTSGGGFRFPITGNASDVTLFWNTIHSGTVGGKSWPTLVSDYYGSLPASVNPMRFICQHVLRNAWQIVKIDAANTIAREATAQIGNFLRLFWPATMGILLVLVNGTNQTTWLGTDPQCGKQIAESL